MHKSIQVSNHTLDIATVTHVLMKYMHAKINVISSYNSYIRM